MMVVWTRVVAVEVTSGHILDVSKMKLTGSVDVLNMGCERIRGIQDDSKVFGLGR